MTTTPPSIQCEPGQVYDAAAVSRILGLPCECHDPVPAAGDGEVVLYYGGWDLLTLRNCTAGRHRMRQAQRWYDAMRWQAEPGHYRVLLRVPDSNRRKWNDQVGCLKTMAGRWQPAPVAVAATALLVHLTATGDDLLRSGWCHCAERYRNNHRVVLTVNDDGRLRVFDIWDDGHGRYLWLAAARKS